MSQRAEADYRVVIIGGGPAGCAAALTLANRGVDDVLLIEARTYEMVRVGESIPPDTRLLFAQLGLLEAFLKEGHDVCYGSFASWGSDEPGYNDFLFNPHGTGWHLDRRRFDAFLMRQAADRGTEIRTETRFRRALPDQENDFVLRIEGKDGVAQTVCAEFIVDATGYRAAFAKAMGAETEMFDRLICVYGFFALPPASMLSRMTMLEATRDGWWYAARLPDGKATAAFAGDPETIKQHHLRTEQGWLWHLSDTLHIAPALKDARFLPGSLLIQPALSLLRQPVAGDRWLAVGDAASVYDPLSAQGVYKALLDGVTAGTALADQINGQTTSFNAYAKAVQDRFESYRANRAYLYNLEQRWADASFWKRRHEKASAARRASLIQPENP
ncbi:MAG TPA: FAD-dependent monooxygenase [Rhodothermales bacterium]|nr:FAD-dependent monooxygenase [Rhodothermales bacterium]